MSLELLKLDSKKKRKDNGNTREYNFSEGKY